MVLFIDIDVLLDIRIRGVCISRVIAILDGLINIRRSRRSFGFVIRIRRVERIEDRIIDRIINLQNTPRSDVVAVDVGVIRAKIGRRVIESVFFNEFNGECLLH